MMLNPKQDRQFVHNVQSLWTDINPNILERLRGGTSELISRPSEGVTQRYRELQDIIAILGVDELSEES